jgi:hypothetical protein
MRHGFLILRLVVRWFVTSSEEQRRDTDTDLLIGCLPLITIRRA